MAIRAILTDIEGTTSSVAFVTETLFPYARARMADYVAANGGDLAKLLGGMDADAKDPTLKDMQGRIWAQGYADGTLLGHVYPDAVEALRRWHAAGLAIYVFSSGSVAAQMLIFKHSAVGDLTPLFSGYFDTNTGPKRDPASYSKIAASTGFAASDILFLSDTSAEIEAAREAGMLAFRVDRETGGGDVSDFRAVSF